MSLKLKNKHHSLWPRKNKHSSLTKISITPGSHVNHASDSNQNQWCLYIFLHFSSINHVNTPDNALQRYITAKFYPPTHFVTLCNGNTGPPTHPPCHLVTCNTFKANTWFVTLFFSYFVTKKPKFNPFYPCNITKFYILQVTVTPKPVPIRNR